MGRGPVCGMMTRRTGGATGAAGASGASTTSGAAASITGMTSGSGGGGGALAARAAAANAAEASAVAIVGLVPATRAPGWAGAVEAGLAATTTAPGTTTGGRPTDTPLGGRLAIAGGGATIRAPWLGKGTILRGPPTTGATGGATTTAGAAATGAGAATTGVGGGVAGDATGAAGVTVPTGRAAATGGAATTGRATTGAAATGGRTKVGDGGVATGRTGAATTACGRAGGAFFAANSACLRSRIAFKASPGLDTCDRLKLGLASTTGFAVFVRSEPLKYPRTFSAWSSSMELEWVLPITPRASSASRIGLLFTSSSLARSLMRTLLIRPFSFPLRR
jgi:hypothetical protein